MAIVTYQGRSYECSSEETLLDSLLSQGATLPAGCRGGMCQACMLKSISGTPPEQAQAGIKPQLQKKNYFLACQCRATEDMEICLPDRRDELFVSQVLELDLLNRDVVRLRLHKPDGFSYRPGQFVNLMRGSDGLARSYSLASLPAEPFLEFHIKPVENGRMSNWIAHALTCGDEVLISDPMGDCCYRPSYAEKPLLLAATGTGLAPLYGVIRDALANGHECPVYLLHGGINEGGLYYQDELKALAEDSPSVHYLPCVLKGPAPSGGSVEPIDQLLASALKQSEQWCIYLCGDSATVELMRTTCLSAGVDECCIHTDSFG